MLAKMRVCAPAPCTVGRNDMGLLEIEDGRAERQQADPGADAEQIGRADQLGQRREGAAADALLACGRDACVASRRVRSSR